MLISAQTVSDRATRTKEQNKFLGKSEATFPLRPLFSVSLYPTLFISVCSFFLFCCFCNHLFTLCNTVILLRCSEEWASIQMCVCVYVSVCESDREGENSSWNFYWKRAKKYSFVLIAPRVISYIVTESHTCNLSYFLLLESNRCRLHIKYFRSSYPWRGNIKNSNSRQALQTTEFLRIVLQFRRIITPLFA